MIESASIRYEIVVFFIAGTQRGLGNRSVDLTEELALVDLLYFSMQASEGTGKVTLLTDNTTDVSLLRAPVQVVRYDLQQLPLMLARLMAESRYVSQHAFRHPLVLMDTDMLVIKPIAPVFEGDFDIGVTLRRGKQMPLNSGVRFINNRRPDVSRRFVAELAEMVATNFYEDADWWADQLALNAMVQLGPKVRAPATVVRGDYRVRILPVSVYNYSPPPYSWAAWLPLRGRRILHFKSARRKRLMPKFFRRLFGLPELHVQDFVRARAARR